MSAILLAITAWDPAGWDRRFRDMAPERDIRLWPGRVGSPEDIAYACAWKPPAGLLAGLPNLRALFSLGAGVDHLLSDPALPDVPLVRIVDPDLTLRMGEYVCLHVLLWHRRQRHYDAQQRARVWEELRQPAAGEVRVGVMGLGEMGRHACGLLRHLGFAVGGWSRTPRDIAGVETFVGAAGLDAFLARTDILVCLLPLTPQTRGILCRALFARLAQDGALGGPFLINAGRGGLQVEADILTALDDGTLKGAALDVFDTEPLPVASALWTHPLVTVTPHNAAASAPRALARYVIDQIAALERGEPLRNVVDRAAGY